MDTDRGEIAEEFLDFLRRILAHPGAGKSVPRRIRNWLSSSFGSLCLEAADEYVMKMQEQMERSLERLCQRTTGQLWCDFEKEGGRTQYLFLDVPLIPSSLYKLAGAAVSSGILYSRAENEITAVRVTDGISLTSCRAISGMQKEYSLYRESAEMNLHLLSDSV